MPYEADFYIRFLMPFTSDVNNSGVFEEILFELQFYAFDTTLPRRLFQAILMEFSDRRPTARCFDDAYLHRR